MPLETRLAIASKRDHRDFDPTPLDDVEVTRILDAGRLAGSARNRQPWRFLVATGDARARIAPSVYVSRMVLTAPLVVVLAVRMSGSAMGGFDAGRAAQSMMLAAWSEGIASCPNGVHDPAGLARSVDLSGDETPAAVLAFGRPRVVRDPARRSPERWSATAHRLPLEDLVVRLD